MKNRKTFRLLFYISCALTVAICGVMNLWLIPAIESSTQGIRCFDMNFFYSPQTARQFLALLTEEGRTVYLTRQLPLDFFYPVAYTTFFALIIRFSMRRSTKLAYLPVLLAILDYGENICILRMLKATEISDALAVTGSVFTTAKNVVMFVCLVLILILLVRYVILRKKEKQKQQQS